MNGSIFLILFSIDNETLARIGCACYQQLIVDNAALFHNETWNKICRALTDLLDNTRPQALFHLSVYENNTLDNHSTLPASINQPSNELGFDPSADFQKIINLCVLQLLLVQQIDDLVNSDKYKVYQFISASHLLLLFEGVERSYDFAYQFNSNIDLRLALWKAGFMKQLPNLLKQETSAMNCCMTLLFKMYSDSAPDRFQLRPTIEELLFRLVVID